MAAKMKEDTSKATAKGLRVLVLSRYEQDRWEQWVIPKLHRFGITDATAVNVKAADFGSIRLDGYDLLLALGELVTPTERAAWRALGSDRGIPVAITDGESMRDWVRAFAPLKIYPTTNGDIEEAQNDPKADVPSNVIPFDTISRMKEGAKDDEEEMLALYEGEIATLQAQAYALANLVAVLRKRLGTTDATIAMLHDRVSSATSEKQRLAAQLQEAEKASQGAKAAHEKLATANRELQDTKVSLSAKTAKLQEQIDRTRALEQKLKEAEASAKDAFDRGFKRGTAEGPARIVSSGENEQKAALLDRLSDTHRTLVAAVESQAMEEEDAWRSFWRQVTKLVPAAPKKAAK